VISARVSAFAVVLVVCGVAGLAVAGKPAPPIQTVPAVRPNATQTLAAVATAAPAVVATAEPEPVASAAAESHHLIYGDDGIFGLPGRPWRGDATPAPTPTLQPSRYVLNWRGMGPGNIATR
jgi:hypothetical protein